MKTKRIPIITIMALLLVMLATSCDRRNIPVVIDQEPVPISSERYIDDISATPDIIYADYGITYSLIKVLVEDGEGFGVPNQIVSFKTTLGRILTNVPTDSTGVATTTLWDAGVAGEAQVTAVVRKYSDEDPTVVLSEATQTVTVNILPVPDIDSVTLEFQSTLNPFPMTVMQTTEVSAAVKNVLDEYVPNNTLVTFTCSKGRFVDAAGNVLGASVVAKTTNGRATVNYNSGATSTTSPGMENALIRAAIGTVYSEREVVIRAGAPAVIDLRSYVFADGDSTETQTNPVDSANEIKLYATLNDLHGNACQTKPVKFSTDLGTFMNTTQLITVNTGADGKAITRLIPGLQAGAATIQASANGDTLITQLIFSVTSSEIHSISFTQDTQIDLSVANTGGTESAILRVKLRDINGNLIDTQKQVWFRLLWNNPNDPHPEGANLNNQPPNDSVMVMSTGGEAQISVNSGPESGVLVVRASHIRESDSSWIRATKANILIHAGPPATITPFIGRFNTGQNMGGGLWRVIAGAEVYDIHGNPVDKNTSVFFEIINNTTSCTIEGNGYVGNVSVEDDSMAAIAYTIVTYSGVHTNEMITIQATTGSGTGAIVQGFATLPLPLNDPRFEIQANPQSLNFGDTSPDWKSTEIYCVLTDGQGCLIGNQEIMLVSTKGQFVAIPGFNNDYPAAPVWMIKTDDGSYGTGNYAGWAWGQIRFHRLECPAGDPQAQSPGQTTGSIIGRILGTAVTDQTDVAIYRYWTPAPPF